MALPTFELPLSPINIKKPKDRVSEAEKFDKDGQWFLEYARWITAFFYNPMGMRFNDGEEVTRWADGAMENFAYYYGRQTNNTFDFQTQLPSGGTVPVVYVPDQKIRQLVDHMIGNCEKMVKPIRKSLSATAISYEILRFRSKLKEQLMKQVELQAQVEELKSHFGVEFSPNNMPAGVLQTEADVDEYIASIKEPIELQAVKLARSIYYENGMDRQFIDDSLHQFVGNLSTTMFDIVNDRVVATNVPSFNAIFDYRSKDDHGKDAMLGGGVFPMTPTQIFAAFPGLSPEEMNEIEAMCEQEYSNWDDVQNYYNCGLENLKWWPKQKGTCAVAFVRWIGPKDLRYKKKTTMYGGKKIKFLEDSKEYQMPAYDENGKVIYKGIKGSDVAGDGTALFEHFAVVAGNKFLLSYGYSPIQVRSIFNKNKPELSVKNFCFRLTMGYARSIVSRLRHYSDEKGRLMLKLQELTAKDKGRSYVVFADKLEGTSAAEIYEDFSTIGITVINRNNGQPIQDGKFTNMGEMVDLSLSPSVQLYRQLVLDQSMEMEALVNIPSVALGMQQQTIGKGVQQNTLQQATLGQLSMYEGLQEFWRIKMQYAINLFRIANAGKEINIRSGPMESHYLKVPSDARYQDIGIFIETNDDIEGRNRQIFEDALFNYGQNVNNPEAAEALLNIMKLMRAETFNEGIGMLEEYVVNKKKSTIAQQQEAQSSQDQMQVMMQRRAEENAIGIEQMKQQHADYRAEIQALSKNVNELLKIIGNPMSSPIEQRQASEQQAQQQQAQQQQQPQPEMEEGKVEMEAESATESE